jgi:hypothetical protein
MRFAAALALLFAACSPPRGFTDATPPHDTGAPCVPACAADARCIDGRCFAPVMDGGEIDAGTADAASDTGVSPDAGDAGPRCTDPSLTYCVSAPGCVDIHGSDNAHCGGCDIHCDRTQLGDSICMAGSCTCADGGTPCVAAAPGDVISYGCEDTQNSPFNCGSCGHSCASGQRCTRGSCL